MKQKYQGHPPFWASKNWFRWAEGSKIDSLIKQYCINFWENKWTSGWLKLNYEPQCTDSCAIHPVTIIQCFIIDICKSAISPYTLTIRLDNKIDAFRPDQKIDYLDLVPATDIAQFYPAIHKDGYSIHFTWAPYSLIELVRPKAQITN